MKDDNVDVKPDKEAHSTTTRTELAVVSDVLPPTLLVLPLRQRPFFPIQSMPVSYPEEPWLATFERINESQEWLVGLLLARPDADDLPQVEQLHEVGCAVRIHQASRNKGAVQFIAEGLQRFRVSRWISKEHPFRAQVEYLTEDVAELSPRAEPGRETKAYALAIMTVLKELIPLNPLYNEEMKLYLDRFTPSQPFFLSWFAASLTSATGEELQRVLEIVHVVDRMTAVLDLLRKELEVARLHAQIHEQVDKSMSEQQRKFFLREQLKAIQKELGIAKDDREAEIERFNNRLHTREVPPEASTRIEDELQKLAVLETGSPEYAVTRNYLEWLTNLPWGLFSEDSLDLKAARKVLDRDHTGLDDVKERIIEFLAVGKLRGGVAGSIILLVGPPGVGKTSIGHSVAKALGRKFFRFSVGGMRDEAEIKGHRRTYIGAMPGKFLQALKDVQTANPVLMLDEVDKIGASYHGDPASALLEVLDPEQNNDFLDHYLDVRFDLSRVLFICTANQLDTIPAPLLDRMEVIRLSGYIDEEKIAIGRDHLWSRQLERAGLRAAQLGISDAALRDVVEGYARESGVRGLDKQLGRIVRKAAVKFAREETLRLRVGSRNLADYLGQPLFRAEHNITGIGVVTGLAWTTMGGATLDIEAGKIHNSGRGFRLTGQLGDVMRESAEIAMSFISSHLEKFHAPPGFFDQAHVHLHVPAGATPKDGPSAGVTIATALVSLARGRRVVRSLALSGEITLTGQVLPVGGIREKVVAARRNRIGTLVLPKANQRDYDELPAYLRKGMKTHFASHYLDVFKVAFGNR
jgi:ATP-dependent Lon protease